ncbi:MAG: hypothetical protein PV344_07570, partial [Anaplasma sp.]|nr:hypothetical protein [Anaplasma sp.]
MLYVNTMEATFDSRKLKPANDVKFSALMSNFQLCFGSRKFEPAKIKSFTVLEKGQLKKKGRQIHFREKGTNIML